MNKFKTIALISFLFSATYASSENIFNRHISSDNIAAVNNGETVIINTDSYKTLCVDSDNYAVSKLKQVINSLKPVYVAEVIHTYPIEGNENLIEKFDASIMNVKSYVGIPYWSERNQTFYDLYSSAEIVSTEERGNLTYSKADLEMQPFGLMKTLITTEKGNDFYYYESTNTEKLRYLDKIDVVSPQHMKSIIIIFKNDDQWVLYGIGSVKAPNVFFLKERIEVSFMNRIKTFCTFFFEKLK